MSTIIDSGWFWYFVSIVFSSTGMVYMKYLRNKMDDVDTPIINLIPFFLLISVFPFSVILTFMAIGTIVPDYIKYRKNMSRSRRPLGSFKPRECWICGKTNNSEDEIEWVIPGDYKGTCKSHHLGEILKATNNKEYKVCHKRLLQDQADALDAISSLSGGKLHKLSIKPYKEKKQHKTSYMKRIIANVFWAIVAIEVLWHLPHILNLLIDKIK